MARQPSATEVAGGPQNEQNNNRGQGHQEAPLEQPHVGVERERLGRDLRVLTALANIGLLQLKGDRDTATDNENQLLLFLDESIRLDRRDLAQGIAAELNEVDVLVAAWIALATDDPGSREWVLDLPGSLCGPSTLDTELVRAESEASDDRLSRRILESLDACP